MLVSVDLLWAQAKLDEVRYEQERVALVLTDLERRKVVVMSEILALPLPLLRRPIPPPEVFTRCCRRCLNTFERRYNAELYCDACKPLAWCETSRRADRARQERERARRGG